MKRYFVCTILIFSIWTLSKGQELTITRIQGTALKNGLVLKLYDTIANTDTLNFIQTT
jgi:hypothetical protein